MCRVYTLFIFVSQRFVGNNYIKKMKFPNINLPPNKRFGYFFSVIFFIVAGYFLYIENQTIGYIFVIFLVLFILTTLINADLLRPLNKLWMHFGFLLGKIISPIVLGIIFLDYLLCMEL